MLDVKEIGFSQFYVSLEDDLMIRFGSDRIKLMMQSMGFKEDQAIRSSMFTKALESAQKRVEGNNFDIRKQLLEYDDVINIQRELIYDKRNEILDSESIHDTIITTIKNHIKDLVISHVIEKELTPKDIDEILEYVNEHLLRRYDIKVNDIVDKDHDNLIQYISDQVLQEYDEKLKDIPIEIRDEFEKTISLRVIDLHWMEHINTMAHLREGIHLRSYAQENPLRAYTSEGFALFEAMLQKIDKEISSYLLRAEIRQNIERKAVAQGTANNKEEGINRPKKVEKIGRNAPCPCGSGKKYKQCCGK